MAAKQKKRVRVAIIGGGCAAMTAAFELTRPEHRKKYDVTVYQMGFRLGGKGASGRGPMDRIEEHGLHLWMGFYENAFRLMRECYGELGRDPAQCHIAKWTDALKPAPLVAVTDRTASGEWVPWIAHFPPGRGLPGDPLDDRNPFSVRGYLQQAGELLVELLRSAQGAEIEAGTKRRSAWSIGGLEGLVDAVDTVLRVGQLATAAALFEATDLLRAITDSLFPEAYRSGNDVILRLVDAIADAARRQLDAVVGRDIRVERVWQVIDLILTILRGSVAAGLAFHPRGFDAIDAYDWTEWLRMNGASERSLDSGFMRGIYDLMFAFHGQTDGKPKRSFSAGVALRGALRMFFTYRGALFWRMTAGMGDIVFAPLYEVLKKRGVRFAFFHNLRNVKLAPAKPGEKPYVEALEFDVQAKIAGGGEYQPLVDVRGLPCWPSRPDYEQLVGGARKEREGWAFESPWETRRAGTKTLTVGEDFDLVVLGVSLGVIPLVCRELIAREPKWQAMVDHVKTTATQAFQLWLRADRKALGWDHPPMNLSGFVEPFDTWADMSHLIPEESWEEPIESIAYFCSALQEPPAAWGTAHHEKQRARVRENAVRFLDRDVGALWPKATRGGRGFRWDLLATEASPNGDAKGAARFDAQFWTANVNPSDRYVLSVPGSSQYRISPLDLSFDNLTIAGDWTESGLNTGCVESAVMSGMLAAHAVAGAPALEDIIGYDHP